MKLQVVHTLKLPFPRAHQALMADRHRLLSVSALRPLHLQSGSL